MANYNIPFKSINGIDCLITIRDISGTTPIELSVDNANSPGYPAAVPCEFSDDNSENLLEVVRVKTGYINLVEKTYGALEDLYPQTDTQYYVTITYGSKYVFTGYMQAQAFENQWCEGPREISFPIQSPLGLLNGTKFSYVDPVQMMTLGSILRTTLLNIDHRISHVVIPGDFELLKCEINSLVISPYSSGTYYPSLASVYDPITCRDFIEGLCNAYGLIVYDTPYEIIFSRYEYTTGYKRISVDNLDSSTGSAVSSGILSLTPCDDESTEQIVRPMSRIEIGYDGDYKTEEKMNFDRAYVSGPIHSGADGSLALKLVKADDTFVANYPFTNFSIDADGKPTSGGVGMFAAGDKGTANEGIMMFHDANTSGKLFTAIFTCPPYGTHYLNAKAIWGKAIKSLGKSEDMQEMTGFALGVCIIDRRGYYWDGSGWDSSSHTLVLNIDAGGDGSIYFSIIVPGPITVEVYMSGTALKDAQMVALIKEFSLGKRYSVYSRYISGDELKNETIDLNNKSNEVGSIKKLFSFNSTNSNHIYQPSTVGGLPSLPSYSYLGTSMRRLVLNGIGVSPTYPYLDTYTIENVTGKIVGTGMIPSEDKTTVILQG